MKTITPAPNLVEQVADALFEGVLTGELKPGERVIQEHVAQRLGVSRQPVQQALLLLRNRGLLVDAPGRGLMVPALEWSDVEHVYEIRASLEALACRLAIDHVTKVDLKRGAEILARGRHAMKKSHVGNMVAADIAFHELLYQLSRNPLISTTMAPHLVFTQRAMGEVLRRDQEPRDIWAQHEAIWEAITQGDAAKAEALVRAHLLNACGYLIDRLKKSNRRFDD